MDPVRVQARVREHFYERRLVISLAHLDRERIDRDAAVNLLTKSLQKAAAKQGIKIKVETQINGDKLRVSGKKRDDLQEVIALLRKTDVELPLQFQNYR